MISNNTSYNFFLCRILKEIVYEVSLPRTEQELKERITFVLMFIDRQILLKVSIVVKTIIIGLILPIILKPRDSILIVHYFHEIWSELIDHFLKIITMKIKQ